MNIKNKMMITGLFGLLAASVLMAGCAIKKPEKRPRRVPPRLR